MIIASSTKVQARLASAFGVPKSKIAITGYPRHDIIMEHAMEMKRRILYAPTWRKDIKNALAIVRMICNVDFINCLRASGFDLWISIHPLNASITHVLQNELGNTVNFIESNDINIELARCEVLITDYSSIAVDFSLLGRKVIFFAPDIDEYKMTTGLYSEFETIISENVADTIENICHVLKNNDDESYSVQDETYFHYRDSGARKRIVDFVKTKFCQ
jgi:CDP-glycerol glycerophosphotransferase (TagB/SpsB family)